MRRGGNGDGNMQLSGSPRCQSAQQQQQQQSFGQNSNTQQTQTQGHMHNNGNTSNQGQVHAGMVGAILMGGISNNSKINTSRKGFETELSGPPGFNVCVLQCVFS